MHYLSKVAAVNDAICIARRQDDTIFRKIKVYAISQCYHGNIPCIALCVFIYMKASQFLRMPALLSREAAK